MKTKPNKLEIKKKIRFHNNYDYLTKSYLHVFINFKSELQILDCIIFKAYSYCYVFEFALKIDYYN